MGLIFLTCKLVKSSPIAQVEPLTVHTLRVAPCSHLVDSRALSIWRGATGLLSALCRPSGTSRILLFTSLGIWFQLSITRKLKKFLLMSSLPCFTLMFKGSDPAQIALTPCPAIFEPGFCFQVTLAIK
jgi:hypothetical protein